MAQNIRDLEISETYPNILLLNNSSVGGSPANLDTTNRVNEARVQDGLGNLTPLLVSKSDIGVDMDPKSKLSVIRTIDLMETIAQAQNNSLLFG